MKPTSKTIKEIDEIQEIENMKKIEAALFLSARFLSLKELVLLTDINPLMLKELMEKLIQKYNNKDSAIEITSKENMWKMDVGQDYISMVNKLATGESEFTKAEQETLAVIAYKQPVKQSVVIKIRGNKAYDHIKNFIDVGLVKGKRVGHTKELKLSDDFFDYFHLQNREDILNGPSESRYSPDFLNKEAILDDKESKKDDESLSFEDSENDIVNDNNVEKLSNPDE